MKKYLLLSIALSTPHILLADRGTEISSTDSLHQVQTTLQGDQEFPLVDILIGRIQNNPKLLKSFKETCVNCSEENLSSFKSLPPETKKQVANAVTEFAQRNNLAPEMKYFSPK